MSDNLLIVHGGAPTAVINASLYGAISEARAAGGARRVYAAVGGTGGILRERLKDLSAVSDAELELLPSSPGSAIGTSRDGLKSDDYAAMLRVFEKFGIGCILMNGGNGTMDTAAKIEAAGRSLGLRVMGIPKTIDNDIAATDHSPGFGSAARFLAGSVAEIIADAASLPIHIVVVESMGRNAGWLTAASALARDSQGNGPDLVYVPELDFDEEAYLADAERLIKSKGFGVVVVSEGIKGKGGKPLVDPIFQIGRDSYFGDTGAHLANLVIRRLRYKARSEKPGILGRASIPWQSRTDRDEAVLAGRLACRAVLQGQSGKMVAFRRISTQPYRVEPIFVELKDVALKERKLPREYSNAAGNGIAQEYLDWCRPLLGGPLPEAANLLG